MTWKGMLGCSMNSNVSELFYFLPLCKKNPKNPQTLQALHDWLSSLLMSIFVGCTKEFQSIARHLDNKSLGEIG